MKRTEEGCSYHIYDRRGERENKIPSVYFHLRSGPVIQKNGDPINLMKNIPIEIDEIESLMNSN